MTTVADFMARARAKLAGGVNAESLDAVGRLLAAASGAPGFVQESEMKSLHGSESTFTILQTDSDGLTLMLACFSPEEETPVHDHGSWGIACVIRGRDRYRHYTTVDGRVAMAYEKEVGPGSFVTWPEPPGDIHSQQGIDEPAWELVLFGKNVTQLPRHYHDLETGRVRTSLPH